MERSEQVAWSESSRLSGAPCKGAVPTRSSGPFKGEKVNKFVNSAVVAAFSLLGAVGTSNAQGTTILKPVQLGVALGGAIPLGDFGSSVNTGYNVTGTVALRPVGMPVGFRLDGAYNSFGAKGGGGTASIAALTGNVVLNLSADTQLAPYVIGGVGYYHEKGSILSLGSSSENHFGFNAGAGLNIPLTGFTAFIEARYNRISETGASTSFVPVTVGVMF